MEAMAQSNHTNTHAYKHTCTKINNDYLWPNYTTCGYNTKSLYHRNNFISIFIAALVTKVKLHYQIMYPIADKWINEMLYYSGVSKLFIFMIIV